MPVTLSPRTKRKLRSIAFIGGLGLVVGPLFANLAYGFAGFRVVKGMIIGCVITTVGAGVESFLFEERLRRLSFPWAVLVRSMFYFLLITITTILVVVIHESMMHEMSIFDILYGEEFIRFLQGDYVTILTFAAIASFSINFLWQVNRLLGRGVLFRYVTGKYHAPRREERVVMFLDLKSSTTIAEGIDQYAYHNLLNDYFFDINEPILDAQGEICEYVGDEVVITWTMKDARDNANCLRCFFMIREKIDGETENYMRKYGLAPEFKAGIHCGTVIVGEVGDAKREIVIHGDVMNTASRIQAQCNTLNRSLLVSKDLLDTIAVPSNFSVEPIGGIMLKGKQHAVELFGIDRV